ncbi:uncharacterized protein C6orf136 homolog isoform X1 [Diabrotica virgifera virgifera]|uniref:Uncharacterized protein n=1 Tax=Diabrotica virgifera virgifera TaxID=50390 RepID=A0ABM5IHG6_DIAVI|nr:uncharacterized protein C6orf136 homolog isoform X1 [Diabrotica virgifera virgifera]
MAIGFRQLIKFANFSSLVASRSSAFKFEKASQVQITQTNHQYLPKVVKKFNHEEGLQSQEVDNRESDNDLVIKEHVFIVDNPVVKDLNRLRCVNYSDVSSNLAATGSQFSVPNPQQFSSQNQDEKSNKPSLEKLTHVYDVLAETLPKIFIHSLDYKIYHKDIVFEDNIRNIRTVGLYNYVKQVALLRTIGHLKFAYVKFEILKITKHPEDSSVKVRWQIRGISALRVMLTFWKIKLWNFKEIFERTDSWYDGFSTFYVNSEGQVIKHVAEKMMPDSDHVPVSSPKPIVGASAAAKLALVVGIIPKCSFFNSLL